MIAPARRQGAAREAIKRFLADGAGTPGKSPADWQGRCIDTQTSPVGWPIRRAQLAAELTARVDGKNIPNQMETSYCGPAAFLYCLLHDRPDLYVAYAIGLWQHGHYDFTSGKTHMDVAGMRGMATEMRKLDVARKAHPKIGHISNLDWMTMASLSASTRPLRGMWGAPEPSDQGPSVTYPQVLKGWFAAVGSRPVASSMGLGAFKSDLSSFLGIARHWSNCWIVMQIDVSLLGNMDKDFFGGRHWVVMDPHHMPLVRRGAGGPVVPMGEAARDIWTAPAEAFENGQVFNGPHMRDWQTNMRLVSWGRETYPLAERKLDRLVDRVYGAYAFPHIR